MFRHRVACHRLPTPPVCNFAWLSTSRSTSSLRISHLHQPRSNALIANHLQSRVVASAPVTKSLQARDFIASVKSFAMPKYSPEKDIPDLAGKVILVTGGTAGLGAQTVMSLAAHSPSHIFFSGRSSSRATTLISDLKTKYPSVPITFLEIDLTSLASIKSGSQAFLSSFSANQKPRLDLLICNAGVMALPPGVTADGYEIQFGTNHVGHALLTKLLLPTLLSTATLPNTDVRVVFVSSLAFSGHPMGGIIFKDLKSKQDNFLPGTGAWQRYGQSKLANILYAAEMARKYGDKGITAVSIHPGTFNTGLITSLGLANRAMIWITNVGNVKDEAKEGEGSWNSCWAATSGKDEIVNGSFYVPVGVKAKKVRDNQNEKLASELWEWTEKELETWTLD